MNPTIKFLLSAFVLGILLLFSVKAAAEYDVPLTLISEEGIAYVSDTKVDNEDIKFCITHVHADIAVCYIYLGEKTIHGKHVIAYRPVYMEAVALPTSY